VQQALLAADLDRAKVSSYFRKSLEILASHISEVKSISGFVMGFPCALHRRTLQPDFARHW
jgi:hypothetical protein